LDDPEHEFWKNDNDIKNIINELRLFKVQQYKSLLLAVYFSMPNNIKEVLKIIWALTFRYNVIAKFNPNELERSFNDVAIKVHNKTITTPADIHKALEKVYIGDELFKNLFSTVTFDISKTHVKRLVRYILLSIENQQHHKSYDTLSTMDSIEHIFPKNYEGSHNINLNMLDRLGNLTILETQLNLECGNKPFEQKKELYCKSQYIITSELFKFEEWGENEIRERQRQLSRIATAIWRSPYA
jgi:hypothetical protein